MCCCARYAAAPCAPQRRMKRLCWPHTPNTKFYWIMFMLNSIRFTLTTGALVLLLAGCAVGPQYQRPSADVPKAFKEATLRSEEHTSELQSLMRISYAVFCLKKKKHTK